MSQWIKRCPIKPIYLSFMLVWLYFAIYQESVFAWIGLIFLICRLCFLYTRRQWVTVISILLLFAAYFGIRQVIMTKHFLESPSAVQEILLLPDTVKINGDSLSFRGKANGRLYQAYYTLKSKEEQKAFSQLSDLLYLRVEGELVLADAQRNFSGFDYQAYLKTQGIYRIFQIDSILKSRPAKSWNPVDWLSSWRRKALVLIKQSFPNPMRNYMTGLLFGSLDTDFEEMNDLYSSLGIIHLFALSGMQVAFFINGFQKILLRLGLRKETVDKCIYPFSFFYAGMTGFSVSVVRSLIQKLLSQHGITRLDNFACTILILSLVMPPFLLSAGGVLSCAYAFILSMIDVEQLSSWKKGVVESFMLALGILPILLFYFGEFQPWSILLTFVFSILFDVILLPGLTLLFCLSPLFALTQVNGLFERLEQVIRWVSSYSGNPWVFGQPDSYLLLALLFLLALLYDFRQKKRCCLLLSLCLILLFLKNKYPLENEITMLDVSQGQSIVLRSWKNQQILIGVGGKDKIEKKEAWQKRVMTSNAKRNVLPYLKSRGIAHLNAFLVLPEDPLEEIRDVIKQVKVDRIYLLSPHTYDAKVMEYLKSLDIRVEVLREGDHYPIFDGNLQVLSVIGAPVLYGNFYQTHFLLSGKKSEDVEKISQARLSQPVDVWLTDSTSVRDVPAGMIGLSIRKHERHAPDDHAHPHLYPTDQYGAIHFSGRTNWRVETVRRCEKR